MPATATVAQLGLKVDAEEKSVVDQYLAHRNIERAVQGLPKQYAQDALRPSWAKLVRDAQQWKAKQK
jgi:hypothetical protein